MAVISWTLDENALKLCDYSLYYRMFTLKFHEGYQPIMQYLGDLATFMTNIKHAHGLYSYDQKIDP